MRKIGNVSLDYTFYTGTDSYTDGQVEEELLEACKNGICEELLHTSNKWAVLYHLSDIRENLLEWYPFTKEDEVLEIGAGCGAITGILSKKAKKVTCIELSERRSLINAYRHKENDNIKVFLGNFQDIEPHIEKFDYVTLIGVWEYSNLYINAENPYLEMISIAKRHLKPNGKIIIAIENKMGLKYWNGAVEDHTGNLYSGLNDYIDDYKQKVRTFSKMEIEELLKGARIETYMFYYPMPDYKLSDVIYHDEMLPMPGAERNFGKDYSAVRLYNFNDAVVMDQICSDGMFPYFANSFLIVAGGKDEPQTFVKYNRCRKKEFRIKTEIIKKEKVLLAKKSALNKEAQGHILKLKENEAKWKTGYPNIEAIEGNIQNGEYIMPYIDGVDLDTIFYKYRNDVKKFIEQVLFYTETYLHVEDKYLIPFCVSDRFIEVFGNQYPSEKKSLEYTNMDLIFSNLRLTPNNKLYCIDCEWVFDFSLPYEYVIWRAAKQLYEKYKAYLKRQITEEKFLIRIGIVKEDILIYESMEKHFSYFVYGDNRRELYLKSYQKGALMQSIRFV